MTGRARVFAALALLLLGAACGGKDKGAKTPATKGAGATGTTATGGTAQNPEDMNPDAVGDVPTGTIGDGGGKAGGNAGGASAGTSGAGGTAGTAGGQTGGTTGATAPTAPPPPIKPPGLDLSAAQKAAKVRAPLSRARSAMAKNPADAEAGIANAKNALAIDEKNLEAMLYLAHANYAKGYHDKAEYVLRRAQKVPRGKKSAKLYFLYGLVYEATNRDSDAERSFKTSVSLNQNYRPALLNLGVYHIKNKRYALARTLYERLTGPLASKSPAAWTNLGSAYRGQTGNARLSVEARKKLVFAAESSFKRAIAINKNYANAYYNLGVLYLDADPYPAAGKNLDTLVRLKKARGFFDEYGRKPSAEKKLAKEQMAVAQKLHDREVRIREKKRKREERRKKRKKSSGSGGFE